MITEDPYYLYYTCCNLKELVEINNSEELPSLDDKIKEILKISDWVEYLRELKYYIHYNEISNKFIFGKGTENFLIEEDSNFYHTKLSYLDFI